MDALPPGEEEERGRRERKRRREKRRLTSAVPAYHAVLAVKRSPAGFRGINGASPRRRGSPSIYSTIPPGYA
jgi:hypothetical protein